MAAASPRSDRPLACLARYLPYSSVHPGTAAAVAPSGPFSIALLAYSARVFSGLKNGIHFNFALSAGLLSSMHLWFLTLTSLCLLCGLPASAAGCGLSQVLTPSEALGKAEIRSGRVDPLFVLPPCVAWVPR